MPTKQTHDPSVARHFKDSGSRLEEPAYTSSTLSLISTTTPSSEETSKPTQRSMFDRFKLRRPVYLHLSSENPAEGLHMTRSNREGSILPYLNSQPQLEPPSSKYLRTFSPSHPPTIPLPPTPLSPSTPKESFDFSSIASPSSHMIENLDFLKRSLPGPSPSAPLPPIPISPLDSAIRSKSYTSSEPNALSCDPAGLPFPSNNANLPSALPLRRPSSTASLVSSTFRLSTLSFQSSTTSLPSSDGLVSSSMSTCSFSRQRYSGRSVVTNLAHSSEKTRDALDETSRAMSSTESDDNSCDKEEIHKSYESGSESDIDLNTSLSTFAMRSRIISPSSRLLIKKLRSSQSTESTSNFPRRPSLPFLHPKPSIQKQRASSISTSAEILSYEDGWMASDSEEEVMPIFNSSSKTQEPNKRDSLTLNGPGPAVKKRMPAMDLILSFPSPPAKPSASFQASEVPVPTFVRPESLSHSTSVTPADKTRGTRLGPRSLLAGPRSELYLPHDAQMTITGQLLSDEPISDGSLAADVTFGSPTTRSDVSRLSPLSFTGGGSTPTVGMQVLPPPMRMSDEDESVWGEVEVAFRTPQQPKMATSPVQSSFSEEDVFSRNDELPYSKFKETNNIMASSTEITSLTQEAASETGLAHQSHSVKMRSDASPNHPGRRIESSLIRTVPSNTLLKTPVRPMDSPFLSSLPTKQNITPEATINGGTSISSPPRISPHSNTVFARSPELSTASKALLSSKVVVPNLNSRIPIAGKVPSTSKLPRRMNPKPKSPPSSFKWSPS
ncbi:hypothetical protein [Phaffia rhodozyma]|uniref:Uncharacterized protein n=1 Tax=Phaffia rhodozyma TaxID=264483 RepID=A0A0F7SVU7_PHARH|nr:hypothetical protein [Phaffia rhodozyma]